MDIILEGELIELDGDSFSSCIEGSYMTVVMFFVEWCTPCKNMMDTLQSVAEKTVDFKGDIKIATIDCGLNADLCAEQEAEIYPTFVAYRDGNEVVGQGRWNGALHYYYYYYYYFYCNYNYYYYY